MKFHRTYSLLSLLLIQSTFANDACYDAINIVPNVEYFGSTIGATNDGDDCGFAGSADVWYKIQGTGNYFIASTCGPGTDYDTYLAVFSSADGTCSTSYSQFTKDELY